MASFSHLFRHYLHLTPHQQVMTANIHDADHVQEIAGSAAQLTVYHCDFMVLQALKAQFRQAAHVEISDAVFPAAYAETGRGFDLALVQIPVSPSFAIGVVASALLALAPGGRLVAAGNKLLGGRTTVRKLQAQMEVTILDESGEDIIFAVDAVDAGAVPALPGDWHLAYQPQQKSYQVSGEDYVVHTQPGIFSWHQIDPGPAYFLQHIREVEIKPGGCIMDAGCGYGLLGLVMQDYCQPARTVWVDKNLLAVRCTQLTVPDGIVLAADLLCSDFSAYEPFDVIFCVPPFYDAYTEGTGFMEAFTPRARQMLRPDGMLIIVANRVLKFGQFLRREYSSVEVIDDGGDFQMMIARPT